MTYPEFKVQYEALVKCLLKYTPDEVGSRIYSELLGEFVDAHPSLDAQYEAEMDANYARLIPCRASLKNG